MTKVFGGCHCGEVRFEAPVTGALSILPELRGEELLPAAKPSGLLGHQRQLS